jgi:transglutaminase-like putative cysteine protease
VTGLAVHPRVAYRIEHRTRYRHSGTVSLSHYLGCLTPRPAPTQVPRLCDVRVQPAPADRVERLDYFGNPLTYFTILTPYREISVDTSIVIDVLMRDAAIEPDRSPAWEQSAAMHEIANEQFRFSSPYVQTSEQLADYSRPSFPPGRPLLTGAIHLMQRIHADFRYVPGSTSVTTPLTRVMSEQQGVCQDFAHLQIGCLRSMRIPARYVSGYLCTDPPPGRPRLIGADATHAWIAVFCPRHGWVDLDPTNNLMPDVRHITLAWGRDYGDVSPLRGVVLGGGEHKLSVAVTVVPLPAETPA